MLNKQTFRREGELFLHPCFPEAEEKDRLAPCITHAPLLGPLESWDVLFGKQKLKNTNEGAEKEHYVKLAVQKETNEKSTAAVCLFRQLRCFPNFRNILTASL